ncbi:hypothetical protein GGQ73_004427 [Rhizobium skierniewicense]|uniref:Uncharacterized protein n=1 Tax=Rhizobium skierniewicense TaxID=984260 RepID=A0A7W6G423_9HYPH|nr:hypothetical protein [Rhizobium skierniewicense]MBB3948440.1 hypothetical protein [Rhizobium skierniewicense]
MPFFLVTQTVLIEADDEQAAALKAVDLVRAGGEITVAVKADEIKTTYITVPAQVIEAHALVVDEEVEGSDPASADKEAKNESFLKRIFSSVSFRP